MLASAILTAMLSVPPPDYDHDQWEGPALLCAETFSLRLEEGESMRLLFPGTALQQRSLTYFVLQREEGEMQFLEKDNRVQYEPEADETDGTLNVAGARFVFGTFEEEQTGASDGDLAFEGDEHPTVFAVRVVPRFRGDAAIRDSVLRRLGRLPTNRDACTPPS